MVAIDLLSEREHEVLALIVEGLPNKIIADRLGVSCHVIKFHIVNIYKKVKAKSRAHLAVLAVQHNLERSDALRSIVLDALNGQAATFVAGGEFLSLDSPRRHQIVEFVAESVAARWKATVDATLAGASGGE